MMKKNDKIYVAGHRGLVGSAIMRALSKSGYANLVYRTSKELDLCNRPAVDDFFSSIRPDHVFLSAAKVGGIHANNSMPADFIRTNLQIQTNVVDAAYEHKVKKLLFLGSSCIYPKSAPQPMREEYLLTGPLESTNEWYAIAKIAGIKMCQAYHMQYGFNAISLMPTNLYGPGDNFSLENAHVLPALIRKFHEARNEGKNTVTVWGTGKPRREFMHSDDLADAAVFLMNNYDQPEIINVGTGLDVTIHELATIISDVVGFSGDIVFDSKMPDGTNQKLLDVSRINALGWNHGISLHHGISNTYSWYLDNQDIIRK